MVRQSSQIRRIRFATILKEKEFWILIFLVILYFYRPLFMGETFFLRDLNLEELPRKQVLTSFIDARELPLWNPYFQGGSPYLAHLADSALYPSNLLFVLLPLLKAFNLNIIIHFLLCAAFTYFLSRIIGLQPVSSFIAGVIYGFCGYTLSLASLPGIFFNMPYLPLLLLCWHLFWFDRKRKWFVFSVIIGVIQLLTGSHEPNVITMLSLLGWTLCYPYAHTSKLRRIYAWILLNIFVIGIASVQVFPTIELILQSSRMQETDYLLFSGYSLLPKRIPELVIPNFFGYMDTLLLETNYWGRKLLRAGTPFILNIYFGGTAIILACLGGLHRRHTTSPFPFRVRLFLLILFFLSLLFAVGYYLPLFHLVYYIPFITLFRYPIKILIAGILPVALLAGYASEVYFGNALLHSRQHQHQEHLSSSDILSSPSLEILTGLWAGFLMVCIFSVLFLLSDDFAGWFLNSYFKHTNGEVARQSLRMSFIHTSATLLLLTLLFCYRRLKRLKWQHWLLAGILVLDLLSAGKRINPYAPEEIPMSIPGVVPMIRKIIGEGRLFRADTPKNVIFQAPSNEAMWGYRWDLEVLHAYHASFYRIPLIFHVDYIKLDPSHFAALKKHFDTLSWEQKLPVLSAGGVTIILTSEKLSISGLSFITEIPNQSNIRFYLYRNETAAPRVGFVTHWEVVNSDDEALEIMSGSDFDPRKQVILHPAKDNPASLKINSQQVPTSDSSLQTSFSTRITTHRSKIHSARFSISNQQDGYMVFSEPFYPGWRVYLDGKSVPVLRANMAFSAIFLPAGDHEVERRYRPNSFILGILSSVGFCSIMIFVVTHKKWIL